MQFTTLLFAAVAFVGSATAAQTDAAAATLNITNIDVSGLKAGVPFKVTWGSAKGPVTLTLQHGLDANNLETYEVLTTTGSSPEGEFVFTPSADLPSDNYNFLVEDGQSKPNYSKQFQYFGATSSTPTGSNSTTSTTSRTSTSIPVSSDPSSTTSGSSSRTTSNPSSQTSSTNAPALNNQPGSAAGLASPVAMIVLGFAAFLALN